MILLWEERHPLDAAVTAQKILQALRAPHFIDQYELHITASIGIVISDGSEGPEDLVAAAEASMCRAKELHRGGFELDDRSFREAPAVV